MVVEVKHPLVEHKLSILRDEITAKGYNTLLEVDGGINRLTAADAVKSGANVLVAGSFVFSDQMEENITFLKSL